MYVLKFNFLISQPKNMLCTQINIETVVGSFEHPAHFLRLMDAKITTILGIGLDKQDLSADNFK